MGLLNRFKLRTKMMAIVVLLILCLVILNTTNLTLTGEVAQSGADIYNVSVMGVYYSEEMGRILGDLVLAVYQNVTVTDLAQKANFEEQVEEYKVQIEKISKLTKKAVLMNESLS